MAILRSTWLDSLRDVIVTGEATPTLLATLISASIGADDVLSADVDFLAPSILLATPLAPSRAPLDADVLLTPTGSHPAIASYLADPLDRTPRRLSDLVSLRDWTSSLAYRSVFSGTGARFQLSIVTDLVMPSYGRGWVLTRSTNDFSDVDVETAARLLPLLTVASSLMTRRGVVATGLPTILTQREADVLSRIATGATAADIASSLAISPLTVRKHLEHVYRKLGCGDRVHAVLRARDLGLLPAA
jgi:DNA-binding CsgD family transcriptional regulator